MLPEQPQSAPCSADPRVGADGPWRGQSLRAWPLVGAACILSFLTGCGGDSSITGSSLSESAAPTDVRIGQGYGSALSEARLNPARVNGDAILSVDLVVRVRRGINGSEVFDQLGLVPVDVLQDGVTWRAAILPGKNEGAIFAEAESDSRIESIERNIPATLPEAAQSSIAFSEGNATAGDFWDQGISARLGIRLAQSVSRGQGITVAVLDTGVNADHPILQGRVRSDGYDFVDSDSDPSDLPDGIDNDADGLVDEAAGHGCHVAGLVTFVAPAARILPIRVLNSDGIGSAYNVARGIDYAVDRGAQIINMSLSMSMASNVVNQAIGRAVANGVILVCAAGNTEPGGSISPLNYPANDGRVWAVGALGSDGAPASFTAPGPGVVLSAPGVNLLSAYWNNGYATWSGTSMSSPIVAGTAALFLALNKWLTPDDVRAKLMAASQPVAGDFALVGAGQVHPGLVMTYLAGGGSTTSGSTDIRRRGGR